MSDNTSAIADYNTARSQQQVAGRIVTVAIILTVAIFIWMIWSQFTDFRDNGIEEFSANLGAEATEFMPTVLDNVSSMTDRLIPVYIDSFSNVMIRDEEKYHNVLFEEFTKLDVYAQETAWPKIEEALAQLVVDQELAMSDALSDVIKREQVAELSEAYRVAMETYMVNFFETTFAEQTETGEAIIAKLEKLAMEDLSDTPTDTPYLLGMFVELLGLQMQEAAWAESTL